MKKILLPILVLLIAVLATTLMIVFRSQPEVGEPRPFVPVVAYVEAAPVSVRLDVRSQGVIQPREVTDLISEVGGRILRISDVFEDGASFGAGDVLMEIDPLPYETALAEARAAVSSARLALAQEVAQSEQARADWEELGLGEPDSLVLRVPQQEKARADVEAAEARMRLAEHNLHQTKVRAPYSGRVESRRVGVGQVVTASATVLGRIHAAGVFEVRLPVSLREAGDLDLARLRESNGEGGIPVRLYAGRNDPVSAWSGKVVRTESALDPRTRLLHLIARVEENDVGNGPSETLPIRAGMFVEAEIEGILLENAFALPRSAEVDRDSVRVVDEWGHLFHRDVRVRHRNTEEIVVTAEIHEGDRIAVSAVEYFVDGMTVRAERHEPAVSGEGKEIIR